MKKSILMASVVAIGVAFFTTNVIAAAAKCNPGQYFNNKSCRPCPAGKYCPDGKSSKPCPAGSYCPAGAVLPIACTGNTYSTASQASCKVCTGAKQIVNAKHTGCATCPAKQEPNEEHTACVDRCGPGQYFSNKTCKVCEIGKYCPDGKSPKPCPAGSFCPAGATAPQACTGNTYSTAGQASCNKACTGARQIINAKHTGCTNCPAKQKPNAEHTACVNK